MVLGIIDGTRRNLFHQVKYNAGDESGVERGGKKEEEEARRSRVAVHVLVQRKATPKVAQVPSTKAVSPGYSSCGVVAQDRPRQHPQGVLVGTPSL